MHCLPDLADKMLLGSPFLVLILLFVGGHILILVVLYNCRAAICISSTTDLFSFSQFKKCTPVCLI